jgi:hypothetical protein
MEGNYWAPQAFQVSGLHRAQCGMTWEDHQRFVENIGSAKHEMCQ